MASDDDSASVPPPDMGRAGTDGRAPRFRGFARRLTNLKDLSSDARELVDTVLESSDRAKTEMVRMVAREVRTYLEELKLKDDLRDLVRGHSLEVHLSLSLKPLAEAMAEPAPDEAPAAPEADVPRYDGRFEVDLSHSPTEDSP